MIKVEILKNTVAAKRSVRARDVVELTDAEAQFLIHCGKAKVLHTTPVAATIDSPETDETPAPRRRGRRQQEDISQ